MSTTTPAQVTNTKPVAWYRITKINGAGVEDTRGRYTGKVFEVNPHVVNFGQYAWKPVVDMPTEEQLAAALSKEQQVLSELRNQMAFIAAYDTEEICAYDRDRMWALLYSVINRAKNTMNRVNTDE